MDVVVNQNAENINIEQLELTSFHYNILRSQSVENPMAFAELLCRLYHIKEKAIILSPIHWEASHNNAMVVAAGADLLLDEDDARALFERLKDYFEPLGYKMQFHDPFHWLLYGEGLPPVCSPPVYELRGKAMLPLLERLDSSLYWQKLLTETQMLLAQEKINHHRAEKGLAMVNGVWPWGDGQLSVRSTRAVVLKHYMPLAKFCYSQVALLDSQTSFKDKDVLIIDNMDALSPQQRHKINKMNCRLFYNNALIIKKKRPLWKRLFAKGAVE